MVLVGMGEWQAQGSVFIGPLMNLCVLFLINFSTNIDIKENKAFLITKSKILTLAYIYSYVKG